MTQQFRPFGNTTYLALDTNSTSTTVTSTNSITALMITNTSPTYTAFVNVAATVDHATAGSPKNGVPVPVSSSLVLLWTPANNVTTSTVTVSGIQTASTGQIYITPGQTT